MTAEYLDRSRRALRRIRPFRSFILRHESLDFGPLPTNFSARIAIRYAPDIPFPAYAFVPGQQPHPVTNPRGHSFGQAHAVSLPLNPQRPFESQEFLFAIDLFNAGFYWEAHEAWEGLWVVAGRRGTVADFLKGLIKVAAAGVKAREGQPTGVERHARRASELFASVQTAVTNGSPIYGGLYLEELLQRSRELAAQPISEPTPSTTGRPVFSWQLSLKPSA